MPVSLIDFDFGWGSALDPLEKLTVLPKPLTRFKGPYVYKNEEDEGNGEKEGLNG